MPTGRIPAWRTGTGLERATACAFPVGKRDGALAARMGAGAGAGPGWMDKGRHVGALQIVRRWRGGRRHRPTTVVVRFHLREVARPVGAASCFATTGQMCPIFWYVNANLGSGRAGGGVRRRFVRLLPFRLMAHAVASTIQRRNPPASGCGCCSGSDPKPGPRRSQGRRVAGHARRIRSECGIPTAPCRRQ